MLSDNDDMGTDYYVPTFTLKTKTKEVFMKFGIGITTCE
jgi:hypothetical protein